MSHPELIITVATRTRRGNHATNEDACFACVLPTCYRPATALAVVADGIGGRKGGDAAATTAVAEIRRHVALAFSPLTRAEDPSNTPTLEDILSEVDTAIREAPGKGQGPEGMGTTCVIALAHENTVLIGSVGDSRAYILQCGRVVQLTEDQVSEPLTREDYNPGPGLLQNWLGAMQMSPCIVSLSIRDGDRVLLCTDGLHSSIGDRRLRELMTAEGDVDSIATELMSAAQRCGAEDDVTLALLCVRSRQHSDMVEVNAGTTGPAEESSRLPALVGAAIVLCLLIAITSVAVLTLLVRMMISLHVL